MRNTSVAFAALALSSCTAEPPPPLTGLFTGDVEVVDMTHALSAAMPYWPGPSANPFVHDTLRRQPSGAPAMAAYSTPEHHGTHLDAPIHGGDDQPSVDRLSARELFGPAVVVDVSSAAADDPDYQLTAGDLTDWEAVHGRIPPGAVVIMSSGWAERWNDAPAYFGRDGEGRLHFPGFSADAARMLIEERDINGIGVDTPSVDPGNADGFPVHGIVNGNGKYHLENVANVDRLPAAGAYLIVAPIKIEGGSGGQVRIYGVVPD